MGREWGEGLDKQLPQPTKCSREVVVVVVGACRCREMKAFAVGMATSGWTMCTALRCDGGGGRGAERQVDGVDV